MPQPVLQRHAYKLSRGYAPSFFDGDHTARLSAEHDGVEAAVDDIRGKLEPADHLKLYEVAFHASGPILEIGRLHGRSTAVLALGARAGGHAHRVTSVEIVPEYEEVARGHLRARGLEDRVDLVTADSVAVMERLPRASVDVAFIDGDHRWEGVHRDCEAVVDTLRPGAVVLFHDYFHKANDTGEYGVTRAVDELAAAGVVAFLGRFGGLAMFERTA